jgi:hypothetical protein
VLGSITPAQNAKSAVANVINAPESAKVGSALKLEITMTNVSNRAVKGHFESILHGELNYDIEVRDTEGRLAPETCYMKAIRGSDRGTCPDFIIRTHKGAGEDSLEPNKELKGSANLNELFAFRPGVYTVQVSWFEKRTPYGNWQKSRVPSDSPTIKSNIVSVNVTQ